MNYWLLFFPPDDKAAADDAAYEQNSKTLLYLKQMHGLRTCKAMSKNDPLDKWHDCPICEELTGQPQIAYKLMIAIQLYDFRVRNHRV